MSPEMEKDGDASFASDMYSAGVYLIELWYVLTDDLSH